MERQEGLDAALRCRPLINPPRCKTGRVLRRKRPAGRLTPDVYPEAAVAEWTSTLPGSVFLVLTSRASVARPEVAAHATARPPAKSAATIDAAAPGATRSALGECRASGRMATVMPPSVMSSTPFHLPLSQLAAGGAAQSGRRGIPLEPAAVLTARVWWISTSPLSNPSADPARYNRHTRARPTPASLTAST